MDDSVLYIYVLCATVEPYNLDPEIIAINRTPFAVPSTIFYPLKSGHLTNQDTFFCPKGVHISTL